MSADDARGADPGDHPQLSPQVVHDDLEGNDRDSGHLAVDNDELSTDATDSESTDLASEALRTARLIAAGKAAAQPSRRLRRYGRGRRTEDPGGYSGARADARDPMAIGAIVARSSKDLGWIGPLAEARLLGQWASVVGPEIAARCQPTSLKDGELRIAAESTAWATQLRLMQREILIRIGNELPPDTVTKLHISGPSGPSWKHGPWSMRGGRGVRDTYG